MTNPFFVTGIIPDQYFCDREKETEKIIAHLQNQSNILLTSSRRIGKTQLIRHIFDQPAIKNHYYTFYVDIYPTGSLQEFVFFLSKEIYSQVVPAGKKALSIFLSTIRSIAAGFSLDPLTGLPKVDLQLGDISMPELSLEEIFSYLERADKPCIFAIDEFQQISRYPENNVEALLRSHIQTMNNCHFIFSGSNRHILEQMFSSYNRPFYNSAQPVYLGKIDREKYIDFVLLHFSKAGIGISRDVAGQCYDMFDGYTYYIHKVFHDIFAFSHEGQEISSKIVNDTVSDILEEYSHGFNETMASLSLVQKQVLISIAKAKVVAHPTSGAFVKNNALPSPSSTQKALKTLMDMQLVTYSVQEPGHGKQYYISDKYFEKWLRITY